jgi:hypothetical protein
MIHGNTKHPTTGTIKRDVPIGTGLAALFKGDAENFYPYVITADHVLPKKPESCTFVMSHPDGEPRTVSAKEWWRPFMSVDLAIGSLDPEEVYDQQLVAIEIEQQSFPPSFISTIGLGSVVHYVGLLAPMDVPMLRTGSLGNLYQSVGGTKKYPWRYPAHLIDCRSYGGFSGSPVYIEIDFPVIEPGEMSPELARMVPEKVRSRPVNRIIQINPLFGMLTAHLDDDEFNATDEEEGNDFALASRHGVGIVLPIEIILQGLDCKKLRMDRKRQDEEAKAKDDGPPIAGARRKRNLKRDMDERVSLYPLTPEQAVKGLLETPPLSDETDEG